MYLRPSCRHSRKRLLDSIASTSWLKNWCFGFEPPAELVIEMMLSWCALSGEPYTEFLIAFKNVTLKSTVMCIPHLDKLKAPLITLCKGRYINQRYHIISYHNNIIQPLLSPPTTAHKPASIQWIKIVLCHLYIIIFSLSERVFIRSAAASIYTSYDVYHFVTTINTLGCLQWSTLNVPRRLQISLVAYLSRLSTCGVFY